MKFLTSRKILGLFCWFLVATPLFASAHKTVSFQYGKTTANMASVSLALLFGWAAPSKQEVTIADQKSAPQVNTSSVSNSYVGAVVGTMFLAGVVLMIVKLQRHKPRRSIHRYHGRYRHGRSSGSHARRQAA